MNNIVNPTEETAKAIFGTLYRVKLPASQMHTPQYIKRFGVYTTGDKNIDKIRRDERVLLYRNIGDMAEAIYEGSALSIVDQNDAVPIYEAIRAHLRAWFHVVERSNGTTPAPFEDLQKLDRLAQLLFPLVQIKKKNLSNETDIISAIFNTSNVFTINDVKGKPTEVSKQTEPQYDSFADWFEKMRRGGARWR